METQRSLNINGSNAAQQSQHQSQQQQCNSVRAGMRNSEPTMLSFLAVPSVSGRCGGNASRPSSARSSQLRPNQGECCWRLHTSRSLRYRLCGDLLCAVTILPGSLTVIALAATYLSAEPRPNEPYPWLKYAMAALGCLLLALCLMWAATAACVYRKALARKRPTAACEESAAAGRYVSNINNNEDDCAEGDSTDAMEEAVEIDAVQMQPMLLATPVPIVGINVIPPSN